MPSTAAWVLDEDEALELLAYLVTAARTQVDEAAEYGPMRLLTAARRLADMIGPRASEQTRGFITDHLEEVPLLAVPRLDGEPLSRAGYVAGGDGLGRELAELLPARFTPGERAT